MSTIVTEAFVQQFDDTFRHVAQQMTSRMEGCVRIESGVVGSSFTINRLGMRTAQQVLTRHGDTPINDQPHSTRFGDMTDWDDGDMLDNPDKIRMLIDPSSDYIKAMVSSLNRAKDSVILSALGGNSRATSGNVVLTDKQKIAAGGTGLTKTKLIQARVLFRTNEADEENGEELYCTYAASGLSDLLSDTTLSNTEVNTVLSMQAGAIKDAMLFGFRMVPTQRGAKVSTSRYNYAWAKSGVTLGIGAEIVSKVGEDPGKRFNTRYYARMSLGAVRVEEEKVVEIISIES